MKIYLRSIFVALTLVSASANAPAQTDKFRLNLVDVEILSLIRTIAEQTGKNFVVDPRVSARVTVVSGSPVDARELYDLFITVLNAHGYSALSSGPLIKIVPDSAARNGPVPIDVIALQHAPAGDILRALEPLQNSFNGGDAGVSMQLSQDPRTNTILLSATQIIRSRVRQIISELDRPVSNDGNTEVVFLRHANAEDLEKILLGIPQSSNNDDSLLNLDAPVFDDFSSDDFVDNATDDFFTGGPTSNNSDSDFSVRADPDTNSLILTGSSDQIANALSIFS